MCGDFFCGNYEQLDNFATKQDPGFVGIKAGKFNLRPDLILFMKIPGFQPIPFHKMGLYEDAYRKRVEPELWPYDPLKPLPNPRPLARKARRPSSVSPARRRL